MWQSMPICPCFHSSSHCTKDNSYDCDHCQLPKACEWFWQLYHLFESFGVKLGNSIMCAKFPTYSAKWWYLFFVSILPDIIPTDYSNSRSISSRVLPVSSLKTKNKTSCVFTSLLLSQNVHAMLFLLLPYIILEFILNLLHLFLFSKKRPPQFSSLSPCLIKEFIPFSFFNWN